LQKPVTVLYILEESGVNSMSSIPDWFSKNFANLLAFVSFTSYLTLNSAVKLFIELGIKL